jgi:hypothetical protein
MIFCGVETIASKPAPTGGMLSKCGSGLAREEAFKNSDN